MEAKELRIGNYAFTRNNKIIRIDHASIENLVLWERTKYSKTPPVKPIPLNEDWVIGNPNFLIDANNAYSIKLGSTFITIYPPGYMGPFQKCWCWIYDKFKFVDLPYIHSLQNLYNVLSGGNELTIK